MKGSSVVADIFLPFGEDERRVGVGTTPDNCLPVSNEFLLALTAM